MTILFVLAVLVGFAFHFASTWGVTYAARIAWGSWLVAALLWAVPQLGVH